MAGTISAFFQSLLPTTRAPAPRAPTRLASESRAVGSTQGSASANAQATSSPSFAYTAEPPMATTSASASETSSSSSPGGTSEADPDEVRRLRNQFLNDRFGAPGKKGGRNGRPKTSS
ncbi:hypothetical protein PG993_006601 [Apiospora rasikravindrae]|uniref:Uncharacterized protein n=1 Tax=Apiospora rasikravindrae TaxID=990691 RepID=A0ABR1T8N6_9PEZI